MHKISVYLRPLAPRIVLALTIKFIGSIMDLFLPWILAHIIDVVVPTNAIGDVLRWGGLMVLCAIIALVANMIANRMASRVARETTRQIRYDLFSRISYLSSRQMDHFTVPSLVSRLTSDTYHVHHMVGMVQRLGIRAPILLIGAIMMTMTLDPVLSFVLIGVMPLIGLLVFTISIKGIPLYDTLQTSVDHLVRVVRENLSGIRIIKALSKVDYEKTRFAAVNAEVSSREMHVGKTMALTTPGLNLLLNLGLSAVILVGAFRADQGYVQSGVIIAFLTYFTIMLNAMMGIRRIFILFSKGKASFNRIQEVLETPADLSLMPPDICETDAHIVFEDVSFSYLGKTKQLKNISFELKRGETLGIIGGTGSGKSTLIKLLLRFYDPDSGVIRINGQDIRSMPNALLHTIFGVAFQSDVLFADTVGENIDFGRGLEANAIHSAAADAQAAPFINALDTKYDYALNAKGVNLSGGQRQRLLISRALAGNPEILLLDDASSALDYRTDAALRGALSAHYADTTTIIVAQRISTIKDADHILVLDDGMIIGYGKHIHLLETCPDYRDIYEVQMGGVA